jgi:hypothetical protein
VGATGTATIDFGSAPGTNSASTSIVGQIGITSESDVEAWFMGVDSTSSHNAYEHSILPLAVSLSITSIAGDTGFTVTANTRLRLTGQIAIRWVWN